jgi:probable HAF family extracellular repeat protein
VDLPWRSALSFILMKINTFASGPQHVTSSHPRAIDEVKAAGSQLRLESEAALPTTATTLGPTLIEVQQESARMNHRRHTRIVAMTLLALVIPASVAAQDATQTHHAKHHHYKLIDIPTLGGPNSSFGVGGYVTRTINRHGTAIAQADTSIPDPSCMVGFDCLVNHPVQWRNGVLIDLGSLPGVNSSLASWINSRGWVAGFSENGLNDPLTSLPETDAVLWKDGEIINLGTLGGNASGANAVNDRGQVVGGALNSVSDPFSATFTQCPPCIFETFPFFFFPVTTQAHAFMWQDGVMQDLGTLGGPDSLAWFVNQRGQVAGQSTINSTPNANGLLTINAFFWDDGKMLDAGNLGGTFSFVSGLNNRGQMTGTMTLPGDSTFHPFFWSHGVLTDVGTLGGDNANANAINDAGEIVGFSGNQGNQAVFGFLWKHGAMTSLGTVDGDLCSAAHSINAKGQVVGESSPTCFNALASHGFLWENGGPSVDLNILIPPGSGIVLGGGVSINDHGEIDTIGVLANGDVHAVLLIPCDENHTDVEGCDYSLVEATAVSHSLTPHFASSEAQHPSRSQRANRHYIPGLKESDR